MSLKSKRLGAGVSGRNALGLLGTIVAVMALAAPARAAQTIGLTFTPTASCQGDGRTQYGQKSTAPDPYVVPNNGVITSWTFTAGSGPLSVKLKVGTSLTNRIVRTDAESQLVKLPMKEATTTPAKIPVSAGQRIGFFTKGTSPCYSATGLGGVNESLFADVEPYDQTPGMSATYQNVGGWVFPITAKVEPDIDGDGFGDETQDPCPLAAGPAGCPLPVDPAPPAPSGGGAPAVAPDRTPPVLSPLSLSRPSFKASASTQVSYVLSEAGTVVLTVDREAPGRRVAGACKQLTPKNKAGKPCDRWLKTGSFTVAGAAGPNVFSLPGRIQGKALAPGAYRVRVSAADSSNNPSTVSQGRFTIVK